MREEETEDGGHGYGGRVTIRTRWNALKGIKREKEK